ncbi:MAG: polyprenyl synthetase family protein [Cyanobacteria bacterium P01_H01_bin.74]
MPSNVINQSENGITTAAYAKNLIETALFDLFTTANTTGALSQSLTHHFVSGGSRTRALLCYFFSRTYQISENDAVKLACAVECLHNASLIHDDLQDKDTHRRGEKSVWACFGSDTAICAGDFLISAAYRVLAELSQPDRLPNLIQLCHEAVQKTVEGQLDDLSETDLDVDQYKHIASRKSGPLLALSLKLPLSYSKNSTLLQPANTVFSYFAKAYQMIDDLEDYSKDQRKKVETPEKTTDGLNLVTIFQQQGHAEPFLQTKALAAQELQLAYRSAAAFSEDVQALLVQNFQWLEAKLEKVSP